VLVSAVIVEDHVDDLAGRHLALDGVKQANELLVPVPLHAAADHLAVKHVKAPRTGWWCRCACNRASWCRPGPFFNGRPGWVRSSAWIWLFSSTDSTMAWGRRIDIEPDNVVQLGGE
jgi:hypothetical protein